MHVLLMLVFATHILNNPVLGQDLCKGVCKWGRCASNCIQKSRCVWNNERCKGAVSCRKRCISRVCAACNIPPFCDGNFIDVAVVGGGVSGFYSAWKLSQHYNWSIRVFDSNDRLGGRTFSVPMSGINDFKADLGAMRFRSSSHKRLFKLAKELGLTIQPFTTPNKNNTLYYFREELLDKTDIASGSVPYKMTQEERDRSPEMFDLLAYWNNKIIADDSKDLANPWDKVCVDGKMAYEKGNYNAFLEVGSQGAIDYLANRDGFPGSFYHNINYVDWSGTDNTPRGGGPPPQDNTFKEGFEELVLQMSQKLLQQKKTKIFLNFELQSVSHNSSFGVLQFTNRVSKQTVHLCARNIILGLPAESLKLINFVDEDMSQTLAKLLPAVKQAPATKTYMVYDNPWWRHLGKGPAFNNLKRNGIGVKYILTDLPLGQILEIGVDQTSGKAMLLFYNDFWDKVEFWSSYMMYGTEASSGVKSEFVVTEKLIRQINIQLAKVFNIKENQVPMPISSITHAWYKKPYWAGWHEKVPGFNFPKIQKKIIKPVKKKAVYIVGEAFSDHQGWVEGALQTSEDMLLTHFNIFLK